jgi:hypothetical protein
MSCTFLAGHSLVWFKPSVYSHIPIQITFYVATDSHKYHIDIVSHHRVHVHSKIRLRGKLLAASSTCITYIITMYGNNVLGKIHLDGK